MRFFSRVVVPMLLVIYIAVETYAKLHHTSICGTTGCELAGELLRFNSIYLNYFGGAGAVLIALFGYLSLRRESFEKLFFVTLLSAVVFESIMISYQLIANPEPCIFCMGVYSGLLLTMLLSGWRYFLYTLPVVAALFISMSSLAMSENRSIITDDGTYLISSKSCPHCKKVKAYFVDNNITYSNISVKDTNARFFIKQLGITTIPVLVIKNANHTEVIKGDHSIVEYFDRKDESQMHTSSSSTITSLDMLKDDEEGCSASIIQEDTGCSEESSTPLR